MTLSKSADKYVHQMPIEARILRKIIKTMRDAGNPIVKVDDREEVINVATTDEIIEAAFAVEEVFLIMKHGGWVRFILGNEWDCLVDYTLSIEDALKPVNDYIERYMR
jgi:hypothetical protein